MKNVQDMMKTSFESTATIRENSVLTFTYQYLTYDVWIRNPEQRQAKEYTKVEWAFRLGDLTVRLVLGERCSIGYGVVKHNCRTVIFSTCPLVGEGVNVSSLAGAYQPSRFAISAIALRPAQMSKMHQGLIHPSPCRHVTWIGRCGYRILQVVRGTGCSNKA